MENLRVSDPGGLDVPVVQLSGRVRVQVPLRQGVRLQGLHPPVPHERGRSLLLQDPRPQEADEELQFSHQHTRKRPIYQISAG